MTSSFSTKTSTPNASKASQQDEHIIKSALAFVVLRRRLKAKQNGSSISSSLPFESSAGRASALLRKNDKDDDSVDDSNDSNDGEQEKEVLPFLNTIRAFSKTNTTTTATSTVSIGGSSNRTDGKDSSSSFLSRSLASSSSSVSTNITHLSSMFQIATNTASSLYANVHTKLLIPPVAVGAVASTSSGSTRRYKKDKLNHDDGDDNKTVIPTATAQSSKFANFSFIYDFNTASIPKITTSSTTSSKATATTNKRHPKYNDIKKCVSQYAVLDGLLHHITSQLRLMKQQQQQHIRMNTHTKSSFKSSSSAAAAPTSSKKLLYTFIIQQFLYPIATVIKSSSNKNNIDNYLQNHTIALNHIQYIQNVLSTCSILHRLVLFDSSLSLEIIQTLCQILRCLYYNFCNDDYDGGNNMVDILLQLQKAKRTTTKDDTATNPTTASTSRKKFKHSKKRKGSTTARRHHEDNNDHQNRYHSVNVIDVLAVNCLILLEQVIGMSLTFHFKAKNTISSNIATTNTVVSQLTMAQDDDLTQSILSELNVHLGPDLLIPVSTNDMACMYVAQERHQQSAQFHHNDVIIMKKNKKKGAVGVQFQNGLDFGAKMMLRLYLYDIVQKLSMYNTTV
jgi:hypothetical protein